MREQFGRNTYDPETGILTITDDQAGTFDELRRHYAEYFGNPDPDDALLPEAITDPEKIRELTAFFQWTAWAVPTLPDQPADRLLLRDRHCADAEPRVRGVLRRVRDALLAIGLTLFCIRHIVPEKSRSDRAARICFWSTNIGLVWMLAVTLFPVGVMHSSNR